MNSTTNTGRSTYADQPLFIETNGFLLRTLCPSDITPDLVQWFNSEELLNGLNLAAPNFTEETLKQFVNNFDNKRNYILGIFSPIQKELIGFYTLDVNSDHKVANITTGLKPISERGDDLHGADLRHKGVLWATTDALINYFLLYKDIDKAVARVLSSNRRMLFNFMNNPLFVFEARLYKECLGLDGKRVDVLIFSTFKEKSNNAKAEKQLK